MATPKDVLGQLLSPAQAEVLSSVAADAWLTASSAFEALAGASAALEGVSARLVMPEEITDEFVAPHLVLPLTLATEGQQSATAYAIAGTAAAATFFDTASEDEDAQEQQTMLLGASMLTQVMQSLNRTVFGRATNGLQVTAGDLLAGGMPEILAAIDEPALALNATLALARPLAFTLVLPGTFLDLLAAAMAGATTSGVSDSAQTAPAETAPAESSPTATRTFAPEAAPREPTPIASAPAAHRARFAPLPDPDPMVTRQGLDMLAGLDMRICVELGRTELTVSEVLALGAGSVIELDRLAGEPVDILVNDRLIARGEVVVVDENFGVRVVEVIRRGREREEASA